jgi:hypothetical protein
MIQSISPGAVGPSKYLWSLNMAIDLDWLISRFDNTAEKHPGLALVMIPSVDQFTEENSLCNPATTGQNDLTFYLPKCGKHQYQHQFYGKRMLDDDALVFPHWHFGYSNSVVFKSGCWSMWLHRKYGPAASFEDDTICLDTYRLLFNACTVFLSDAGNETVFFSRPESGLRGEMKYDLCLPWLLFLMTEHPMRKEGGVRVIDDVGLASSIVLRSMRDSSLDQNTTQAPQQADEDGAIDAFARTMKWGDEEFTDIPARAIKVLKLLMEAYRDGNRIVTLEEIQRLGFSVDGGMRGQLFKRNQKNHPVSKLVDSPSPGQYRLRHPREDS